MHRRQRSAAGFSQFLAGPARQGVRMGARQGHQTAPGASNASVGRPGTWNGHLPTSHPRLKPASAPDEALAGVDQRNRAAVGTKFEHHGRSTQGRQFDPNAFGLGEIPRHGALHAD